MQVTLPLSQAAKYVLALGTSDTLRPLWALFLLCDNDVTELNNFHNLWHFWEVLPETSGSLPFGFLCQSL
jgi:hypothetical protein